MGMNKSGITLLGLGPGDASLITKKAWEVLIGTNEVYLRTLHHPVIAHLPTHLEIHSFDHLYENENDFSTVYNRITEEILELGKRPEGVVYAVPGHPFVAETTCLDIFHQARNQGIEVYVVEGISFIESTLTALGLDPFPQIFIVDALELATRRTSSFPPDTPALIGQIHSLHIASEIKLTLMEAYPDEHPVKFVHYAGTQDLLIEEVPLYQIDQSNNIGMFSSLYIPPMEYGTSFEVFQDVIAHLRAPDGCPWDREQTHLSLRPHLLEETYEALSALDNEDIQAMKEEFGDLLLQIVLHAQIASEFGEFTMADVIKSIYDKIIRRHPHVFGDLNVESVEQVLQNWEIFKAKERDNDIITSQTLLDGVASSLPALAQAEQYQIRTERAGIELPGIDTTMNKIKRLLQEIRRTEDIGNKEKRFGDVLFAITLLATIYRIDAESALRLANESFQKRLAKIENNAHKKGDKFLKVKTEEVTSLWK